VIDFKTISSNEDKLHASYRVMELARLEHNKVGKAAKKNWKQNESKFRAYQKEYWKQKSVILTEQLALRKAVRRENISDEVYRKLDLVGKIAFSKVVYGDKKALKELPTIATSPELDKIKVLKMEKSIEVIDPIVNFTTAAYAETDEDGDIAINGTEIVITTMRNDAHSHVEKSYGAGNFGAVDIGEPMQFATDRGTFDADALITVFGFAETPYFTDAEKEDNNEGISVLILNDNGTILYIIIDYNDDDYGYDDTATAELWHNYWRVLNNYEADTIFDDEERTNELFTIGCDTGADTHEYHQGCSSREAGTAAASGTVTIYDVDIHEAAPQELTAAAVASASSVSNSAIAGTGDAPLTQAVVGVASSVSVASIAGSGNAPLTASPVAVASSVVNAGIENVAGEQTLTASPVTVASSIQTANISGSGNAPLTAAAVAAAASVQAASIAGSGNAPLGVAVIAVASSVQNAALAPSGSAPLTGAAVGVASCVVTASIAGNGAAPLTGMASSPIAVIASVEASVIAGSGIAPLSANVVSIASSVVNASLESGGQYLTSSPVAAASSVQNSAISGSGDAPLTGAVVSVVSSVMASAIAGTGNAPLTGTAAGVASSVVNPSIARTTQHLASSPVAAVSLVRTAAIAGAGTAGLNAVAIAAASSVASSSCRLVITSIIAITMKLHGRGVTSSLNPRSAAVKLNQRDIDMELNPRSATVKLNRRETEIESPYGRE